MHHIFASFTVPMESFAELTVPSTFSPELMLYFVAGAQ
jgi:hypothetical protein